MAITPEQIDKWFGEKARLGTLDDYRAAEIQSAASRLARAIVQHTPPSADQSIAIRKVRESQSAAFQAIVFND